MLGFRVQGQVPFRVRVYTASIRDPHRTFRDIEVCGAYAAGLEAIWLGILIIAGELRFGASQAVGLGVILNNLYLDLLVASLLPGHLQGFEFYSDGIEVITAFDQ